MKHIGILAHSFEGAALCYRTACLEGVRRLGPHLHPEITMTGIGMHFMLDAYDQGDLRTIRSLFEEDVRKLAVAGADFFICPDNTAHIALESPGDPFAIPCLHIGEVVSAWAAAEGRHKVAILGTDWTMTGPVYPGALGRRGIEWEIPDQADRKLIHDVIMEELCLGEFKDSSREAYVEIIRKLAAKGCDSVALVCTEIPLLITADVSPLPILDSTRLLAAAAVQVAVGERPLPSWTGGTAMTALTREDVIAAASRIDGLIERTPLIETEIGGARLWLKCECLQTGGAFKLRGATNRLLQLTSEERERGVVAFSSGNHARGVAIAARRLGIRAVIVMPADAPQVKVEGTRSEGAEIIFFDRRTESREAIAADISSRTGAVVVPSFDDAMIVAGQGSVGLEIAEQLGRAPARIVVPCGGGGLASGIALAVPQAEIVIVEPDGWDDMARSLETSEIVPVESHAPATWCDALQTPRVSPITFSILSDRHATALSVSDEEAAAAVRFAWQRHQMVVEPGGAVALAALLAGKAPVGENTVAVLSGGNVDPALHARIVEGS